MILKETHVKMLWVGSIMLLFGSTKLVMFEICEEMVWEQGKTRMNPNVGNLENLKAIDVIDKV